VFARNVLGVKIPEEPIVILDEAIEFPVPLSGQPLVQLLNERQQGAFGWESAFVPVDRQFLSPAELLPVRSKPEAVEEILASN
jgi:hypothetical protein